MAELSDIQKDLQPLAAELKRLEAEYNMFFAGRLPRPPWETRGRVEAVIKRYDRGRSIEHRRSVPLPDAAGALPDVRRSVGPRPARARGGAARARSRTPPAEGAAEGSRSRRSAKVLHVTAFRDPMREMDKLHTLYDSLMDARRQAGEDVVPFHKFAALVKDQVDEAARGGQPGSGVSRRGEGWKGELYGAGD